MGAARLILPSAAAILAVLAAAPALAGGASGCCNLPQTHTVQIPGVVISAPATTLGGGSGCSGCGGVGGGGSNSGSGSSSGGGSGSGSDSSSSSGSDSSTNTSTSAYAAASSYGQVSSSVGAASSATVANLLASGGGSSFYVDQGPSSTIGTLNVEGPVASATGPVCLEYAPALVFAAVQATCLDDKDVPHPASQVMPGRDVADGYVGEVFRCIAGSRMQYVVGSFAGQPDFGHGQTVVCRKGDALWREGGGRLQCRPQIPARDCNERSLLRRYGAGIKVMHAVGGGQCVRWGGGQSVAAEGGGAVTGMLIDGGVGGVAH